MMRKNASSAKIGFVAQKEKLLQEIKYYEKRIADFPRTILHDYNNEINSSDSEDDIPLTLDIGPSISELKQQERLLRTCLQATQELTSIGVLQSEVNFMVQDPPIEGEKSVTEPGSWREVTAECRIDLVPFSLTFYTHQPGRKFASASYRGLRVLPVKKSNEAELSNSVLSGLTSPSDAIEVLRSYAVAYRSRRTTLARLADTYAASLSMEPMSEGGFVLKCANLLKMSWRLVNQASPVAPFHHKMNFDLEYMDNSYLKIIKQAHRQLSDPSLKTDERTQLLAKIISTCLEAQAPTQELYESMESDPESIKKLEKTILEDTDDDGTDREDEYQAYKRKRDERNALESTDDEVIERDTELRKRKRDEEVMAPPKSIPKKAKPKGKENMDDNRKSVKRGNQVDGGTAKKAKTDLQNSATDTENFNVAEMVKRVESNAKHDGNKTKKVAPIQKNTVKGVGKELNEKAEKEVKKGKNSEKTVDNPKNANVEATKVKKKVAGDDKVAKNVAKDPKVTQDNAKSEDNPKKVAKKAAAKTDQVKTYDKNNDRDKKRVNNENKTTNANVNPKSDQNDKVLQNNPKKNVSSEPTKAKYGKSVTNNAKSADPATNKDTDSKMNNNTADKNHANPKNNIQPTKNINNDKNKNKAVQKDSTTKKPAKNPAKIQNNKTKDVKISKIPQKKLSPAYAAALKENPVRLSPRMMSKLKSISDTNIRSKIFKTVTNIPRLKKPSTIV